MTLHEPLLPTAAGRLDGRGRLVDAEERLLDLNARAGGRIGAPLALPSVAAIARLAQRLGISIARNVVAADGEADLELGVRAVPDEAGVRIELSGWRLRPAWPPSGSGGDVDSDFLRAAADWTWETDASLRIGFVSPDAGWRYGFDPDVLIAQPLTRLFRLIEDARGDLPLLAAVAAGTGFAGQEAELRGTGRMVRLEASPRRDAGGRFVGFTGGAYMLDAPEELASPEPLRAVPDVAHGNFPDSFSQRLDRALREPLTQIIANAESIAAQADGPLGDDYAEYAGDIASAGRHLAGLVDDLVDLQAIERPDFAPKGEAIDLADVARRAAGLLGVRAAQSNVRIDRPGADERLPVTGEARRALQVLVNLIGNAVRYSPSGGTVWIRLEREGQMGCAIIADQGMGIAREDQERIFEKFGRLDADEPGGSGLGLYIARRLARAMGGDLTVDSAPGLGARFVFKLACRD